MQSITEKNYRKLVLKVSLRGFSYAVTNTLSGQILQINEVSFEHYQNPFDVEGNYKLAFTRLPELGYQYDQVTVLHDNNLSSFVPEALFDKENIGLYLQYNVKVFETDYFAYDTLSHYGICNAYVPYAHINNLLLDQYPSFDYKHASSILVEKLLDLSKNKDEKQMFVHFHERSFEIVVVENQKLLFYNSFDFTTKEDFAYYLLFSVEQLGMNPENFPLYLLGHIAEEGELYKIAYTFVRNVSLLDTSYLQEQNQATITDNLTHFVLLQS